MRVYNAQHFLTNFNRRLELFCMQMNTADLSFDYSAMNRYASLTIYIDITGLAVAY